MLCINNIGCSVSFGSNLLLPIKKSATFFFFNLNTLSVIFQESISPLPPPGAVLRGLGRNRTENAEVCYGFAI